MSLIIIKMTDAQLSALECGGIFEDIEDRYLPAIINGKTLSFTECARDRVFEIITDISNSEDAMAEETSLDSETRKLARRAAAAAANLGCKILRA